MIFFRRVRDTNKIKKQNLSTPSAALGWLLLRTNFLSIEHIAF